MIQQIIRLALLLTGSLHAQSTPETAQNMLLSEELDSQQLSTIYALTAQLPIGAQVAVALIDGDQTHYYGAVREREKVTQIDNRQKAFGIGSITKVFTGILLADAVMDGRVRLKDSVSTAYDFPFGEGIDFTYGQLATHTSGLPRLPNNMPGAILNPGDPYGNYTPEKLQAYLRKRISQHRPGEEAYSNLGFGLLGYTLTHQLQENTLAAALQESIFDPLGMQHTSLGPDSSRAELAVGYKKGGKKAAYWHFTDAMAGAGAIVSTPEDLVLFLRAQLDDKNEVLALTRRPIYQSSERSSKGLGWAILKTEKGNHLYWHNGGVGGYSSFAGIIVERQLGVVVLASTLFRGDEVDQTAFALLRSLTAK